MCTAAGQRVREEGSCSGVGQRGERYCSRGGVGLWLLQCKQQRTARELLLRGRCEIICTAAGQRVREDGGCSGVGRRGPLLQWRWCETRTAAGLGV